MHHDDPCFEFLRGCCAVTQYTKGILRVSTATVDGIDRKVVRFDQPVQSFEITEYLTMIEIPAD